MNFINRGRRMGCVAAGALCVLTAWGAPPAGDPMQAFYGNTMISKHPDGEIFEVWFNPDHTFLVMHRGKLEVKGSYTAEEGKLCMLMDPAKPAACHPFKTERKPGEVWTEMTAKGPDELSLMAGRAQ